MGLVEFTLQFDSTRPFCPGGMVTGEVTIVVDKPIQSHQGVIVLVEGEGRVKWSRCDGYVRVFIRGNPQTIYRGEESYFSMKITVVEGGSPLSAGTHKIPFVFPLPLGIPCSFEGEHGYVKYTARATIIRPCLRGHLTEEVDFEVSTILDLNLNPQSWIGVSDEESNTLCCLWCKSGPIMAWASLPKSGYALGETVSVDWKVDNQSDTPLHLWVVLEQVVKCHIYTDGMCDSGEHSIVSKRKVGTTGVWAVDPKESLAWSGEELAVSSWLPPTDLGGACSFIDVSYQVTIIINPRGMSKKMRLHLPITIGTVPLRPNEQESDSTSLEPVAQNP